MWLFHRRKCWGWAGRGSDATPVWWLAFRVNLHPKHIFYPGVKRAACFLLTGFLLPSTVELAFFILLYSVQPFWASHGILVRISHSGLPKSSSELYALFLPPPGVASFHTLFVTTFLCNEHRPQEYRRDSKYLRTSYCNWQSNTESTAPSWLARHRSRWKLIRLYLHVVLLLLLI